MLANLKRKLDENSLSLFEVAKFLKIPTMALNYEIDEYMEFNRGEMFKLRDRYFAGESLDYLFASDGNVPSDADKAHAVIEMLMLNISGDQMARKLADEMHETVDERVDEIEYRVARQPAKTIREEMGERVREATMRVSEMDFSYGGSA